MKLLLAVSSDHHSASRVGLCPPTFELRTSEGGPLTGRHSPAQAVMWQGHCTFWDKIDMLRRNMNIKTVAILPGDGVDDCRNNQAGLVSANKNDILDISEGVMAPIIAATDERYFIRGTEFHVGESGWLEEEMAKRCKAMPNGNEASFWVIQKMFAGLRVHSAHHPPSRGGTPRTENAAASYVSDSLRSWYVKAKQIPPDVAFFGHVHYAADTGEVLEPRVFFCPGWQLMTAFGARIGQAGVLRPVGGWWLIIEDGTFVPHKEIWNWKTGDVWASTG